MSRDLSGRAELLQSTLNLGRELSARTLMFHAAIAEHVGLSATEHKALDLLSRAGSMTAGQLAELSGLTTGAVTGLVDRLEKSGFVKRERDPKDRRRVVIDPQIDKMEQEIGPLFGAMSQRMEQLMAGYSDPELATIYDFLTQSIAVLREETENLKENDPERT